MFSCEGMDLIHLLADEEENFSSCCVLVQDIEMVGVETEPSAKSCIFIRHRKFVRLTVLAELSSRGVF